MSKKNRRKRHPKSLSEMTKPKRYSDPCEWVMTMKTFLVHRLQTRGLSFDSYGKPSLK